LAQDSEVWTIGTLADQGEFPKFAIHNPPTDVISQWNFEKFLIDKDGKVVVRWASLTKPEAIDTEIAKIISKPEAIDTEIAKII
jgi:hypothetical protein